MAIHIDHTKCCYANGTCSCVPASGEIYDNLLKTHSSKKCCVETCPVGALTQNGRITLKIYNVLGQEIRTFASRTQTAGLETVQRDGKNSHGQAVSSGVYFYRLETPGFTKTMKMMMMK